MMGPPGPPGKMGPKGTQWQLFQTRRFNRDEHTEVGNRQPLHYTENAQKAAFSN